MNENLIKNPIEKWIALLLFSNIDSFNEKLSFLMVIHNFCAQRTIQVSSLP